MDPAARGLNLPPCYQRIVERAREVVDADERFVAAFVAGSHAEGGADSQSDLDLALIATDAAYDEVLAHREAFARQLGEPLLLEDFDTPHMLFVILSDGAELELAFAREADFERTYAGPILAVADKKHILRSSTLPGPEPDPDQQLEVLHGLLEAFWHDVSHFATAVARGHLWWAHGQLDAMRRQVIELIRLNVDFRSPAEGYDKLDVYVPTDAYAPLAGTFCGLDRIAMLDAARVVLDVYRDVGSRLATQHGLTFPHALDRLISQRLVVQAFNACINARDADGLGSLMTEDHTFIDSEGASVHGKPSCLDAWRGFFDAFPDYRNTFTELSTHADIVTVVGHSTCSNKLLNGPALWTATVRDSRVAEWRVYEDSPANRAELAISSA